MRRKLIAGNWKMNLDREQATALAVALAAQVEQGSADAAVCPPFVHLHAVGVALAGSPVALGAQNMYSQSGGAFTGEISPDMLVDCGCRYVILGHSERRHVMGETNQDVSAKTLLAVEKGLTPIVCVGETLEQREADKTREVVAEQMQGSLEGLTAEQAERLVIAYEPVWGDRDGQGCDSGAG